MEDRQNLLMDWLSWMYSGAQPLPFWVLSASKSDSVLIDISSPTLPSAPCPDYLLDPSREILEERGL